jgi:hypothetical protein
VYNPLVAQLVSYSCEVVLVTDRKKLLVATLLALAAVVGFSLAMSKWGGNSATEERQSFDGLVTRANDAATNAAEELKGSK